MRPRGERRPAREHGAVFWTAAVVGAAIVAFGIGGLLHETGRSRSRPISVSGWWAPASCMTRSSRPSLSSPHWRRPTCRRRREYRCVWRSRLRRCSSSSRGRSSTRAACGRPTRRSCRATTEREWSPPCASCGWSRPPARWRRASRVGNDDRCAAATRRRVSRPRHRRLVGAGDGRARSHCWKGSTVRCSTSDADRVASWWRSPSGARRHSGSMRHPTRWPARAGGAQALRHSLFDPLPGEGRWATVLLMDGNVGIGGDPVALLARINQLLAPAGIALVEVDGPSSPTRRGLRGSSAMARSPRGSRGRGWRPTRCRPSPTTQRYGSCGGSDSMAGGLPC